MKEKIRNNRFNIIVFIIYASITFMMIKFHELWRDEAQQWFIVKNLNFADLIKQMKYEGHFLLWYLILMPFAKLGFPVITENIISWIISCIAVILVLKKAPFSKLTKVLIIFSSPFLYYYSVHSRVYCLILLAIALCAITYKYRKEKPIQFILSIVLLANTHVIMWGVVGIVLIEYFCEVFRLRKNLSHQEKNKIIFAFILGIVLLILTVIPLFGSLSTNKSLRADSKLDLLNISLFLFLNPFLQCLYCYEYWVKMYLILLLISSFGFFIALYSFKNNIKLFLKIILSVLWQSFIYTFIFGTNTHKSITLILIIFFFVWTYRENENYQKKSLKEYKTIKAVCSFLLLMNVLNCFIVMFYDINCNYSSGKEMAQYIDENIESGSIIINGDLPEVCTSVAIYTDKVKFFSVQAKDYFTFVTWNNAVKEKLDENFLDDIKEIFGDSDNLYYMYIKGKISKKNDSKIIEKLVKEKKLTKLYESEPAIDIEEAYILYKINI